MQVCVEKRRYGKKRTVCKDISRENGAFACEKVIKFFVIKVEAGENLYL
jgi:hypothetical protein